MNTKRPVVVMQVPELLSKAGYEAFHNEMKSLFDAERPRIVLDCSEMRHLDSIGVEILLHCMDEAMKRDGDVKLAAIPPKPAVILELMKVGRLFEIFDTTEEAIQSFQGFPVCQVEKEEQGWIGSTGGLEFAG